MIWCKKMETKARMRVAQGWRLTATAGTDQKLFFLVILVFFLFLEM